MGRPRRGKADYRFQHAGTLQAPVGFDHLVTVSVGPEGPVAVWSAPDDRHEFDARDTSAGGASFPRTRTDSSSRVALATYVEDSLMPSHQVVVAELSVAHPLVQPLPDGEFVIAGGRCSWRPEGPERNALLIGSDGSIKRTGTIGDGIEHMLVDDTGELWVGYFDEGIFGNFGWGNPGPEPLGSAGIVRWSTSFEKRWEYQPVDDYWLADCYVLNIDRDRAWACPYTDFPIVEIESDRTTVRQTAGVSGPRGVVVAGDTVALIGDYNASGALLIGSLGNPRGLRKGSIEMPRGRSVPRGTLVCRGSVANLFVGADWFMFDLSELEMPRPS